MNIFLDDERVPNDVKWITLPNVEWTIVRNYDQFVSLVKSLKEPPEHISFDHDLAMHHYPISLENVGDHTTGDTGHDCAKVVAELIIERWKTVPNYTVHSLNPVGRENIKSLLENVRKFIEDDGS